MDEDLQGFMEAIYGLKGRELDLILHSPGGSAEATEAIVSYLRSKFDNIRVIVPQAAMSAATMLTCSSNRVVLARHSSLGPVDPQMMLPQQGGVMATPAQAILDQFTMAQKECQDPKKLGSWLPILSQYGPALLIQCRNALQLSKNLTRDWLIKYMLAGQKNGKQIAGKIASTLANHSYFKSHGRHIDRTQATAMGLITEELEADQTFQEFVLSVFHALTHTFNMTPAVKIIENNHGRAFVKMSQQFMSPPIFLPRPAVPPQPAVPAT